MYVEGEREINRFYHRRDYEGKTDHGLVGDQLEIVDLRHSASTWAVITLRMDDI